MSEEDTWNEINEHLRVCIREIGYDESTESVLSMSILLREYLTDEHMDVALYKTGLPHWSKENLNIEEGG